MRNNSNLVKVIGGSMVLGSILLSFILTIILLPKIGFRTTDLSIIEMVFLHDKIVVPMTCVIAIIILGIIWCVLSILDKLTTMIKNKFKKQ